LEDVHKALSSKFEYPREQAFKIAQENAALPVSEGGLGLPKDNTPEMRAKAMGYETPMYHGTNEDIEAFNTKGKGKLLVLVLFLQQIQQRQKLIFHLQVVGIFCLLWLKRMIY